MLLAPSLGGMINGLLTLRGAWDKVRVDPVLILRSCDYWLWNGHFEGPMLSLKCKCNCAFHGLIIAHVHVGALAWNGFMAFGMIYWLIPRMTKDLCFLKLANFHF
jgi:cytochrome c oxidase cbb3-type subunit I/II